jgi:hypothetical protein
MTAILAWGCHAGIALFLGSVLTFVVASSLTANASFEDIVFARRLIRRATLAITMPGLWLAMLATAAMWFTGSAPAWRVAVLGLVLLVGHTAIVPATRVCLEQAEVSRREGRLSSAFRRAYLWESVLGGINLLAMIVLLFEQR